MNIAGKILYIFERLREPSTYAALTGLVSYFGITQNDMTRFESWAIILFGILGVFVKEAQPETKVRGF